MLLAHLLQKPLFANIKVLAGEDGLEREIQHINMMDAPDIAYFLKKNEFLVTTAYHLKDNPYSILELIKQMNEQGCAGLGIKTKRFLSEVPQDAIDYANKHHFPIIELPLNTSLGEVVNVTLSYILDDQSRELTDAFEIHRKFTGHIIHGKGIQKLMEELSSLLSLPIILLDQHFKLHTKSFKTNAYEEELAFLQTHGFQFLTNYSAYTSFSLNKTKQAMHIFPISTHASKNAHLVVIGKLRQQKRSLLLMIEQATNVLSFELMKENALKQYTRKARNEFFNHFIEGAFTTRAEIENRGKEFQLNKELRSITIVGKLDQEEKQKSFTQYHLETDIIYEFIEAEIVDAPYPIHLFVKGDICILLLELDEMRIDLEATVIPYLKNLQQTISNIFKRTVSFGISNISQQLIDIQNSYKEAIGALHIGQLSGNNQFIQVHRTKDVTEILRIIPLKDLKEFYFHILQNLASHSDGEEEQILLNTLSVYLETHCQISETAKRLFVHRNTVIYRLEKCEELLGRSLKDPDTSFHLRLAFRIKPLLFAGSHTQKDA